MRMSHIFCLLYCTLYCTHAGFIAFFFEFYNSQNCGTSFILFADVDVCGSATQAADVSAIPSSGFQVTFIYYFTFPVV